MNKDPKLNLNASDYAISHCDSDKTYNGLEVHKMLCDAYIAGNNDTLVDKDEKIKKALINVFATHKDYEMFFGVSVEDIRAWLEKQGQEKHLQKPIKNYQGSFACWNNAHDFRPKHLQRCICYDKYMKGVYCYVYDNISKYWCTQTTEEHDPDGDNHICDYADYRVTMWIPDTLFYSSTSLLEKQEEQKETNLVEILKHYPKETELYSPLYGKLWLAEVDEKNEIITCYKHHLEEGCTRAVLEQEDTVSFYSNGTTGLPDFNVSKNCMLFLYDVTKQCEQKSLDKSELKFHEGDFIKHNKADVTYKVISVNSGSYYIENVKTGCRVELFKKNQNFHHLWSIADAKDGDVLATPNYIYIFNSIDKETETVAFHCLMKKSDEHFSFGDYKIHDEILNSVPATKEERDTFEKSMAAAGYSFDFENKELEKIEQKPADKPEHKSKIDYRNIQENIGDYKVINEIDYLSK